MLRRKDVQLPNDEVLNNIEDGEGCKYLVYWELVDLTTWKLTEKESNNISEKESSKV